MAADHFSWGPEIDLRTLPHPTACAILGEKVARALLAVEEPNGMVKVRVKSVDRARGQITLEYADVVYHHDPARGYVHWSKVETASRLPTAEKLHEAARQVADRSGSARQIEAPKGPNWRE